ncbi:MAG: glycoside hydrolase family 3 N-terminal domain-containing protein [Candidatus Korobacteraceae bacterium]
MRIRLRLVLILLVLVGLATASPAPAKKSADRDPTGARWAERTLHRMSLKEKVGQLFMVWARVEFMNPDGPDYARLRDEMLTYHLGSFGITSSVESGLLVKDSPLDAAALTNQLQADSPLPLLFAADFERGLPMRFQGGTGFPHAMAIGATGSAEYAYQFGRITAAEARAIGIHWNFYPDADVNSNPDNPIINTRAFGEDPAEVSAMVAAFIRGVHAGGGMATAKHFPGHGDTSTDSHLALARVDASRQRLDQVEFAPFRAAIAAGVDSVMVGHLLVPSLEPDPNRPATISAIITTGLLQTELGFHGIIVTDAMDMNGLTRIFGGNTPQSSGRAAVEALRAGADLILIPGDLDGAYNGVLQAVESGELSESRIDRSVLKLLRAKAALGLQRNRFVDLNAVTSALERPDNAAIAQEMADDAVTLVRQSAPVPVSPLSQTDQAQAIAPASAPQNPPAQFKLLPLPLGSQATPQFAYHSAVAPGNHLLVLVFTDDVRSENGRALAREIRDRVPDAHIVYVDDALAPALAPQVLAAAATAERIVAAVYAIPTPGRMPAADSGSPALASGSSALLADLLKAAAAKTVVVAMGNPYLIAHYPAIQNYVCTFSSAQVSEESAAKFLFGEIPARGHLPISIPGIAQRVSMAPPQP